MLSFNFALLALSVLTTAASDTSSATKATDPLVSTTSSTITVYPTTVSQFIAVPTTITESLHSTTTVMQVPATFTTTSVTVSSTPTQSLHDVSDWTDSFEAKIFWLRTATFMACGQMPDGQIAPDAFNPYLVQHQDVYGHPPSRADPPTDEEIARAVDNAATALAEEVLKYCFQVDAVPDFD